MHSVDNMYNVQSYTILGIDTIQEIDSNTLCSMIIKLCLIIDQIHSLS